LAFIAIKPTTLYVFAVALAIAYYTSPQSNRYMSFLRSLIGSRSAHNMVKKTPPKPTVPTAIKSSENLVLEDGGEWPVVYNQDRLSRSRPPLADGQSRLPSLLQVAL
jgi:hypothetical protein